MDRPRLARRRACRRRRRLFDNLVGLLLEQVRIDATQQIASLAENRLGISEPDHERSPGGAGMGLTRARVYQLLNEINDIMAVRWPHGRHQMYELREKLPRVRIEVRWNSPPDLQQFLAAVELFYPGSRRVRGRSAGYRCSTRMRTMMKRSRPRRRTKKNWSKRIRTADQSRSARRAFAEHWCPLRRQEQSTGEPDSRTLEAWRRDALLSFDTLRCGSLTSDQTKRLADVCGGTRPGEAAHVAWP